MHRDIEVFLLYSCSCWKKHCSEFQVYLVIQISHKGMSFLGDLLIGVKILFNRYILQLFYFFGFPIHCLTFHFLFSFILCVIVIVFPFLNSVSFLSKSFITSTNSNISFHYQFLSSLFKILSLGLEKHVFSFSSFLLLIIIAGRLLITKACQFSICSDFSLLSCLCVHSFSRNCTLTLLKFTADQ